MTASLQANGSSRLLISEMTEQSTLEQLRQGTIAPSKLLALLTQYRLLPQLLRELSVDSAIASLTCSFEETIAARQQFYEQHQIVAESDRQSWLQQNHLTPSQLEQLITRNFKVEKFKQATWGNHLESHFLQRKTQLDKVIYSLIRVSDAGVAQELFFRIQDGEQTFPELAREYSQGQEAQTSGLIGPMELSTPHPILAKMLSASQPGQLLPPTRLNDWIVIVRLEKFLPAQLDDSMRHRLLTELYESWLQTKINEELTLNSEL
ncbi:peptidylprolyl isomerase [Phormidesmis sp. 146-35]